MDPEVLSITKAAIHPNCTLRKVFGLDPGFKNMGCAIVQGNQILKTWTHDFFPGNPKWKKLKREIKFQLYTNWAFELGMALGENSVQCIVIEGQMKQDLIALSYFLYGVWTGMGTFITVTIVHPATVKAQFGLSTGNYQNNKEMACLYTGLKNHNEADAVITALYLNCTTQQFF